MSTYAENQAARERVERKAGQDHFLARQTASFDAEAAQQTDKRGNYKTMKYERPSFAVVTASDAFRAGYDQIRWSDEPKELVLEPVNQPRPAGK